MRRVELTFLLVGIDRESLQEIFIYTSYKIVISELLGIYLVNLVHHAFQNPQFKGRFRENLLRQGILSLGSLSSNVFMAVSKAMAIPVGAVRISLSQNVSSVRKNTPSCIY